jgi:hypothetical protein
MSMPRKTTIEEITQDNDSHLEFMIEGLAGKGGETIKANWDNATFNLVGDPNPLPDDYNSSDPTPPLTWTRAIGSIRFKLKRLGSGDVTLERPAGPGEHSSEGRKLVYRCSS